MEIEFIITIAAFCASFVVSFIGLKAVSMDLTSFVPDYNYRKDTFLPVYATSFVAFLVLFALNKITYDFIFSISWLEIISVFAIAIGIYVTSLFKKTNRFTILALSLGVILCSLLLPHEFLLFQGSLPLWGDRALVILIWIAFSWCYQYLNGIDGLVSMQSLFIAVGIFILSLLGAVPNLVGNFSAVLIGAIGSLLIFNWYPAKLLLKTGACIAIGFLLGWMLLLCSQEGSSGSGLIFSMFLIVEVLFAIVKKFSLNPQYANIVANTTYYQTNISGLSPEAVCQNISKILTILLIFGCFQIYSPNNYSLPLASFVLTIWFLSRLKNWQEPNKTLKEINTDVINDLKENVEDIKKIIK